MPNDLTAAQLIALIRQHPLTCGEIGVSIDSVGETGDDDGVWEGGGVRVSPDTPTGDQTESDDALRFRRWLTGACVEKLDELEVGQPWDTANGTFRHQLCKDEHGDLRVFQTRLHALLAGLEADIKETSK